MYASKSTQRFDPIVVLLCAVVVCVFLWGAAPFAGAVEDSGDVGIGVDVDPGIALTPPNSAGDTTIKLSDITAPGQQRNASSTGWGLTNASWFAGYSVTVESVSDPALRGMNAVDGNGAPDSFSDYSTSGSPSTWNISTYTKGVFGYSVSSESDFVDSAKWGTSSARKFRGFDDTPYTIASQDYIGDADWDIHFRTELGVDAVQEAGSYRAPIIVSITANI